MSFKTVRKLDSRQQELVVTSFMAGSNQTELGELFGVSRSTIRAVLQDAGCLPPSGIQDELVRRKPVVTEEQKRILALLESKGMTYEMVEQFVNQPILTEHSVKAYLANLSLAQTTRLLTSVRVERSGVHLVSEAS